jgi:hypothetical protein
METKEGIGVYVDLTQYGKLGQKIYNMKKDFENKLMNEKEQQESLSILTEWINSDIVDFTTKLMVVNHLTCNIKDFSILL